MGAMESVVKSVGRVFAILEAFARVQAPMTAIEIGRRLDYPASSTAALLKSMVALGYLSFDRVTRAYQPTILLGMLTRWVDAPLLGSAGLERLIDTLHRETGEMVIVATQTDLSMKYLLTRPGRFPVTFMAPAGMLRPLCGSGTGWAWLASRPDAEIAAIVARIDRAAPAGQGIDARQLHDLLAQVRHQGYAASYGNVIAGSGVIAMALPDSMGATLVVGIGGPVERLQRNETTIAATLRRAVACVESSPGPAAG